jgi:acyl carrier protein
VAPDQIEAVLEEFFVEREGKGVLAELRSMDLVAEGLLDSIDTLILATFLEEKTGIDLDITTDKALAAMRSFDGLVALAADQAGAATD